MSEEEYDLPGITDGLVRVSVGIEDWRDLLADFEDALDKIPAEMQQEAGAGSEPERFRSEENTPGGVYQSVRDHGGPHAPRAAVRPAVKHTRDRGQNRETPVRKIAKGKVHETEQQGRGMRPSHGWSMPRKKNSSRSATTHSMPAKVAAAMPAVSHHGPGLEWKEANPSAHPSKRAGRQEHEEVEQTGLPLGAIRQQAEALHLQARYGKHRKRASRVHINWPRIASCSFGHGFP